MKKTIVLIGIVMFLVYSCAYDQQSDKTDEGQDVTNPENLQIIEQQKMQISSDVFLSIVGSDGRSGENQKALSVPVDVQKALQDAWDMMNAEQQAQLLNNTEGVMVEIDNAIEATKEEQAAARSSEAGNVLTYYTLHGSLHSYVKSVFGAQKTFFDVTGSEVYAAEAALYYAINREYDSLKQLAASCAIGELDLDRVIAMVDALESATPNLKRSSGKDTDFFSSPLVSGEKGLGVVLGNADVLVVRSKNGHPLTYWHHAGVFDKNMWITNGQDDLGHSVITAQPKSNSELSKYNAQRPGYNTYEPLGIYNYASKVKVIRPKAYTDAKANTAITKARDMVKNAKEYFLFGNNCSYTTAHSWKSANVNLDSNSSWIPQIIDPNDVEGSIRNRYQTMKIRVLWWSWTKTWKVYSATANERYYYKR